MMPLGYVPPTERFTPAAAAARRAPALLGSCAWGARARRVDATTAYALMLGAIVGEIVLTDSNAQLAEAEALDTERPLCAFARRSWAMNTPCLPVSSITSGQYGISAIYLSSACVIGAAGVERVITPPLGDADLRGLRASAEVLRATHAALQDHARAQSPAGA